MGGWGRGCMGGEVGAQSRDPPIPVPAFPSCPGRTQTPRAEVKDKFTAFAKAQGFTEDTIVFLPQTGAGC